MDADSHARPNALEAWPALAERLRGRELSVFLDYDGTLTPIVPRPEDAALDEPMRETLRRLAEVWPVQLLSGRALPDLRARVGLDSLWMAGNHGFELGPPRGVPGGRVIAPELEPEVHRAADELRRETAAIPGAEVEDKRFSCGVHYRLVEPARLPELERAVERVAARHPGLRRTPGKRVFQLQPAVDWNKGRALQWLLEATGHEDAVPIFAGDDTTDEDALAAVAERGVGILVAERPRPTTATHSLRNSVEVRVFLERLTTLGEPRR